MNEQVKYFAKLSAVAVFTVVKMYALAMVSTALSLVACLLIMIASVTGAAPHVSGAAAILVLIAAQPLQSFLALVILACGVPLVVLSGKYAMNKVVHRIISDKGERMIAPFMDKVIERYRKNRPAVMDRASDATLAKMRLAQEAKKESGDRWLRGALALAFKKARLDDIDLSKEDARLGDVIRDRTMLAMREMSQPSKTLYWTAIGVQWICVLLAWVL